MLRFAISAQNVAMLRHSNIRQNCFAYEDPVTSKQVLHTIRSDYIDVKIINFQRSETTKQMSWLLLHNEHATSIFMMK